LFIRAAAELLDFVREITYSCIENRA